MQGFKVPRLVKLIAFGLIVLFILFWLNSKAFLEISVNNVTEAELTYTLSRQPGGKATEFKTADKKIKRLVNRGSYEVAVSQNLANGFTIAKTGGWLTTTKINVDLVPEKARSFIGDNPEACQFYDARLYSYSCDDVSFNNVNLHTAATAELATYKEKLATLIRPIDGQIEGLIKTAEGNLSLIHAISAEGPEGHVLYLLDNQLRPLKHRELEELNNDQTYSVERYKSGLIIYALGQAIYYLPSFEAELERIPLRSPDNTKLKPVTLTSDGQHILLLYSTAVFEHAEEVNKDNLENELVIYDGQAQKSIRLDGRLITESAVCGSGHLCLLEGESLGVYEFEKPDKAVRSFGGVKEIKKFNDSLLIVQNKHVLRMSTEPDEQSIDYSFSDYRFCGLQPVDQSRYILCVADDERSRALLIEDKKVEDDIDKKILSLSKLSDVDTLSAYGNVIHISPKYGDLIYDKNIDGYIYDPEVKKRINTKIENEINDLSINKEKYKIVVGN